MESHTSKKNLCLSTLYSLAVAILLISHSAPVLAAQPSENDLDSLYNDTVWYDVDNSQGCGGDGIGGGTISADVGKGLPDAVKQRLQQILVAAGKKFGVDPNFIASFYYNENARSGDSTNNADSASPPPTTGDGRWREPAPPYGNGTPYGESSAGAKGPFQFIDSTWGPPLNYGIDGNGDGKIEVTDLTDAAFGAAKYLAALGGKAGASEEELRKAAFGYNKSDTYVQSIINTFKYLLGGGQSSSGAADCGGNPITIDGYTWPVDIKKTAVSSGYSWPCSGNCHHDNTPAFDLSTKSAVGGGNDATAIGRAVFAITDGTIDNQHIYEGIPGCYSLQLKSSRDDYSYYYAHFRKPIFDDGDPVKSGDKLGEIGERRCTGNYSYPHLHIDRGSPKGELGGYPCCRDPGLTPLINGLYEKLPQ
jgi:murein DD-endopeptidase MepM/ murein hydrolase activator NlpD